MNAQVDIMLINSIEFLNEKERPQLGQLILSKILAEKYNVEWINFGYLNYIGEIVYENTYEQSIEKYATYIVSKNPKIVGLYTICSSFITTIRLANAIKTKNDAIKIVFGGPHATMLANECLKAFPFVDVVMLGESEKNIVSVVERLLNNRNLDGVYGVAYRETNGIIIVHNTEPIDEYQLTNYTVYDFQPYDVKSNEVIFLEAGRGCPFACTFCSTSTFWGRKFRIKPIQHILTEMKRFHEKYGVTKFSLLHDLFTANKQYIRDFCKACIEENLDFSWDCSSRIDVLDKATIDFLAKAGCSGMFIGIETGSPIMQCKIRKNLNIEKAEELISYLLYRGIKLTVAFIYGYPEETIVDFKLTVELMERLRKIGVEEIQLGKFIPLPKTIETDKVKERLFFKEDDINFSIYKKYVFDDITKRYIKEYPELFIQYYSFESEVRSKYGLFDLFHATVISAGKIFYCSLNYILEKYTWLDLYDKYIKEIELYVNSNRIAMHRVNNFVEESCHFFNDVILENELVCGNEYFNMAYSVEILFCRYCLSGKTESETYKMGIDYLKMRKQGKLVRKAVKVMFGNEHGHPRIMQYETE